MVVIKGLLFGELPPQVSYWTAPGRISEFADGDG
jgi:hypothetical protein